MNAIKQYLAKIDEVISNGRFKDNWQSLSAFKMPEWYKQGRFGLFIHWGCYSVPAVQSEWFPREMYQKGTESWDWRVKNLGENGDYRTIVERFNPQKFNADEWLELFKKSGAKYIMPVCEHHDGIKMYKSELNRWNMWDMIGRDFEKELHDACDKYGIGYLASNHRAEHLWFLNGAIENCPGSEAHGEEYRDLYGPCQLSNEADKSFTHRDGIIAPESWLEDWLASACEMIDRNKPLAVYFDWYIHHPEYKPYLKKFLAYYYNRADQWGIEPAVFYKMSAVMPGCAVYDVERGQISGISPELWQCDTAIAKNSWGYTENNQFKTPYECVTNLIDVISKNGCFMLNVGPKSDGTICDEEKAVLLGIGKFVDKNSEAIYDSKPFIVFGEGKMQNNGSFKENLTYSDKDYRFTYKTGAIYVFPMSARARKSFTVKSLRFADEGGIRYNINGIEVLGYDNKVSWKQTDKSLKITLGEPIESDVPLCFKLSVD